MFEIQISDIYQDKCQNIITSNRTINAVKDKTI